MRSDPRRILFFLFFLCSFFKVALFLIFDFFVTFSDSDSDSVYSFMILETHSFFFSFCIFSVLWNRHFCCDAVVGSRRSWSGSSRAETEKKKTYLGRKKQIEISTKVRAADVVGANAAVRLNRLTIQSAATRYVKEFFRRFRVSVRGKASASHPSYHPTIPPIYYISLHIDFDLYPSETNGRKQAKYTKQMLATSGMLAGLGGQALC